MNQEYIINNNTGEPFKFIREKGQEMAPNPLGYKWVRYMDSWFEEYWLVKIDTQR